MKKILSISCGILALFSVSCNKAVTDVPATPAAGEKISISATLSDIQTKVSFGVGYDAGNKPTGSVELTWADGDAIRVYDHSDRTKYEDFTLDPASVGQKKGIFTGTAITASAYDVEVINAAFDYASQTQPSDGETSGLKYLASASNIASYDSIDFTDCSSVLAITAKMPSTEVAAAIKSVEIAASEAIFNGGKTLAITFDAAGDAGADGILHFFATLPSGGQAIAAGTSLIVRFNAPETDHTVYTRYIELPADSFSDGAFNAISINASKSDKHAGLTSCDGTSEAKAYLIGDKYQLLAVDGFMVDDATTYFKMIDDIDMAGETWTHLNAGSGYKRLVDFDGNGKTISNLSKNLFYVFKGSIRDLTLDHSTVTGRGIFAEYIQGTGHKITNVNITNGSVNCTSSNVGGMIGRINSGTAGTATVTITGCTVSGTNVTGAGIVGGVIGFPEAMVVVSGCKYTGGTVTASDRYVGGFAGSMGNDFSTFTDCQVEDATINVNCTNDARGGGFAGMVQDKVVISGCTVGTPSAKVVINTKEPTKTDDKFNVINTGGFTGVCYGTITKNGDVRSKAYARITSTNTQGTPLKLGGFVGYHSGTIEYCDAIVDMTNIKGQYIGGFAGYVVPGSGARYAKIDNCTADGDVSGNNFTAGFAAFVEGKVEEVVPVISNSTSSGTVLGQSGCGGFTGQTNTGVFANCSTSAVCTYTGSNNGGFAGWICGGTLTGCSSSGDVTANGGGTYAGFCGLITNGGTATIDKCSTSSKVTNNKGDYSGGFIGAINNGTATITRCFATGDIYSDKRYVASFIGNIHHATNTIKVVIENCYATGNIVGSNYIRGGFIGQISTVTSARISNCYASGAVVGSFRLGGFIGIIGTATPVVERCVAWNSEVTASDCSTSKWSSGAVVATAHPNCHLTDNYRKPGLNLTAWWVPDSGYSHPDVDGTTHPLVRRNADNSDMEDPTTLTAFNSSDGQACRWAYQGKVEAGKTLSQLASATLGWDSAIWDFSGELPKLK